DFRISELSRVRLPQFPLVPAAGARERAKKACLQGCIHLAVLLYYTSQIASHCSARSSLPPNTCRAGVFIMQNRSRREFLEQSMFATASALAAGSLLGGKAAWADEAERPAESTSPNEKLGVAVVGVRGRGGSHIQA